MRVVFRVRVSLTYLFHSYFIPLAHTNAEVLAKKACSKFSRDRWFFAESKISFGAKAPMLCCIAFGSKADHYKSFHESAIEEADHYACDADSDIDDDESND